VKDVNDLVDTVDGKKPFYIVGDLDSNGFKYHSYWFKVHCRFCGDFFQLCLLKKKLLVNLQNDLQGLKHSKVIADSLEASKSTSTPLSIGCHGRLEKSNSSMHNQQVLVLPLDCCIKQHRSCIRFVIVVFFNVCVTV
jgi:hypothetical protein